MEQTYGNNDSVGEPENPLILMTLLVKDRYREGISISGPASEHNI